MPRCAQCFRRIAFGASCPRHDPPWTAPAFDADQDPTPEPSLAGFRVLALLGRGGFSSVWDIQSIETEERFALKLAHASNSLIRARFHRDVEAMHKIGSPAVPEVRAAGMLDDGRPWILMERLIGHTLAEYLEQLEQPWPLRHIFDVADRILSDLGQAHAVGYVHRDLKPENIFICRSPFGVRLLDFGIGDRLGDASLSTPALTREGTALGTAEYMAPEQLQGSRHIGIAADIYAFGILLFELLTLRLPFDACGIASTHCHLTMRPHQPSAFVPVPQALDELILQCLEKEPRQRPPSVDALRIRMREAARIARVDANNIKLDNNTIKYTPPSRLVVSAHQPAVLLYTDAQVSPAYLGALVRAHKGLVARFRTGRFVAAFLGADARDPLFASLAAAFAIETKFGARVALHLAVLRVRRKSDGTPTVYGEALEQPELWLPSSSDWEGTILSSALSEAAPELNASAHPTLPAFFMPRREEIGIQDAFSSEESPGEPSLVGRDDCLHRIHQRIQISLAQKAPSLLFALGPPGAGKSRIASETLRLAARSHDIPICISLRCDAVAAPFAHGLRTELGRALVAKDANFKVLQKDSIEILGASEADPLEQARTLASALLAMASNTPLLLVIDDAHLADSPTLDAVELATLGDRKGALIVLLTAEARLLEMRPRLGLRAEHFDRIDLHPLPESDAISLAAELLKPAEYAPREALARLAAWGGGNPGDLSDICRALKRAGIIKSRPGANTFYLATDILDRIEPAPAAQWLALRRLDALRPELCAFVRFCAVLGNTFSRSTLMGVQRELHKQGREATAMDIGVAINSLVLRNLLRASPGEHYAFESPSFQAAVAALSGTEERNAIHTAAMAYYRHCAGLPAEDSNLSIEIQINAIKLYDARALSQWVFHALALGLRAHAAKGALTLGEDALYEGNAALSDRFFSLALDAASPTGAPSPPSEALDIGIRMAALHGRATARYRLLRVFESLTDLRTALELAEVQKNTAQKAALLLEMATALDWANRYEESARAVEEAGPLAREIPHLQARLAMAEGRSHLRTNKISDAIELLEQAERGARELGDSETLTISGLLLSSALVLSGRLDEAEPHFARVIEHCSAQRDFLHMGSAYANRALLWTARGASDRAMDDLGRAIEIAREAGNPWLEHNATHNVAELLYWNDQLQAALGLARRARALGQRFMEHPVPDDSMLLARILAAVEQMDEARVHFDWIEDQFQENELGPILRMHFRALKLLFGAAPADDEAWDRLENEAARELPAEEYIEILTWRIQCALHHRQINRAQEMLGRIDTKIAGCPIWRERTERLGRHIHALLAESSTACSRKQSLAL